MERTYIPKTAPRGDSMMPPDDIVTDGDILSSLPSLRYEVVVTLEDGTELIVEGSTSNPPDLQHRGLTIRTETRIIGPDHVLSQLILCNGHVLAKHTKTKVSGKNGVEYTISARPLDCLTLGTRDKGDGSHKCMECIYCDRAQGRDYLEELVDTGIGGERPVNKEKMRFLANQLKKRAIQPHDAAFCAMHNALIEVTHSACAHFEAENR